MADSGSPGNKHRTWGVGAGIAMVSGSSYVSMLLGMFRGLLVARVLGPTYQGVLSAVNLVLQYAGHAHVGLLHGMNKRMPYLLGQRDQAGADECRDVGVTGTLLLSSLCAAAVCAFALAVGDRLGLDTRLGLLTASGTLLLAELIVLYQSLLRTYGAYHIIGVVTLISAVLNFVLMVGLARVFSIRGALLGLFLRHLLTMLVIVQWSGYRVRWSLKGARLRELLAAGFPILVLVFSDHLLRTADRLVILKLLHAPGLGVYTIGTVIAGLMYALPRAVGYVLFPRYMELRGREASVEQTRRQLVTPVLALACLAPFLAGVANIALPWVVHTFLEKYVAGVRPAQWLVWAPALQSLGIPGSQAMVAADLQWRVVAVNGAWIPVVALLGLWLSLRWNGLVGPAVAALVGQAWSGAIVLTMSLGLIRQGPRETAGTLGRAYALAGYMAAALFVARLVGNWLVPGVDWRLSWCAVTLLVYGVLAAPPLWYAERRLKIRRRLLSRGPAERLSAEVEPPEDSSS